MATLTTAHSESAKQGAALRCGGSLWVVNWPARFLEPNRYAVYNTSSWSYASPVFDRLEDAQRERERLVKLAW